MKHIKETTEYLQKKYDKEFGFGTCTLCSIAIADSEMYDCRTYPDVVFSMLKRFNGITENNYVIWNKLNQIFRILPNPFLYDRKKPHHHPLNIIQTPAIISIDGQKLKKGYQSHFLYLRKIIYLDLPKNRIFGDIFCPLRGNIKIDLSRNDIYSIVNLSKNLT